MKDLSLSLSIENCYSLSVQFPKQGIAHSRGQIGEILKSSTIIKMPAEYNINGRIFVLSKEDLDRAMCSTNECLDAGFNIQLEMLSSLIESKNGNTFKIEKITKEDLKVLQEKFPGTEKSSVEEAVKSYYSYAVNMYNI